ncbi:MAG: polysaccharide deacetylase family protein [Clostridia bacterium]|nr:polysaccharide deacetylase family protein [Clostridia bacterium]
MSYKFRKILLRLLYALAYYTGAIALFYRINRNRQRILVFHHIVPDCYLNDSFEQKIVCTAQSKFDRLLSIVGKRLKNSTTIGEPGTAVITFDDGYRAALTAREALEKHACKAYFFVPLSVIGGGPLWVDRIMGWFAYVPAGTYRIGDRSYTLTDQPGRQASFSKLMDSLYDSASGSYEPHGVIAQLESILPFDELPIPEAYRELRFKGLTNSELQFLKTTGGGHLIGGHSVRHDILSQLDREQLDEDFNACSAQTGTLFNCRVYAYPFGHKRDVSPTVIEACRNSAFEYAVLNEYSPAADAFALSRLNISQYATRFEVEAALSGFTQWLKNLIKWIR